MEIDVDATNDDALPEHADTTDKFYALMKNLDYQSILELKYYENQGWFFVIKYLNYENDIYFCNICEYQINGKAEVLEHIADDTHKLQLKIAQKLSHPKLVNDKDELEKEVKVLYENEIIEISNESTELTQNEIQQDVFEVIKNTDIPLETAEIVQSIMSEEPAADKVLNETATLNNIENEFTKIPEATQKDEEEESEVISEGVEATTNTEQISNETTYTDLIEIPDDCENATLENSNSLANDAEETKLSEVKSDDIPKTTNLEDGIKKEAVVEVPVTKSVQNLIEKSDSENAEEIPNKCPDIEVIEIPDDGEITENTALENSKSIENDAEEKTQDMSETSKSQIIETKLEDVIKKEVVAEKQITKKSNSESSEMMDVSDGGEEISNKFPDTDLIEIHDDAEVTESSKSTANDVQETIQDMSETPDLMESKSDLPKTKNIEENLEDGIKKESVSEDQDTENAEMMDISEGCEENTDDKISQQENKEISNVTQEETEIIEISDDYESVVQPENIESKKTAKDAEEKTQETPNLRESKNDDSPKTQNMETNLKDGLKKLTVAEDQGTEKSDSENHTEKSDSENTEMMDISQEGEASTSDDNLPRNENKEISNVAQDETEIIEISDDYECVVQPENTESKKTAKDAEEKSQETPNLRESKNDEKTQNIETNLKDCLKKLTVAEDQGTKNLAKKSNSENHTEKSDSENTEMMDTSQVGEAKDKNDDNLPRNENKEISNVAQDETEIIDISDDYESVAQPENIESKKTVNFENTAKQKEILNNKSTEGTQSLRKNNEANQEDTQNLTEKTCSAIKVPELPQTENEKMDTEIIEITDDYDGDTSPTENLINPLDFNEELEEEIIDIPDDCEANLTVIKENTKDYNQQSSKKLDNAKCIILCNEILKNAEKVSSPVVTAEADCSQVMETENTEENPLNINIDTEVIDLVLDDEETEVPTIKETNLNEMETAVNELNPRNCSNLRKRRSDPPPNTSIVDNDDDVIEILSSDEEIEPAKKSKPNFNNSPSTPLLAMLPYSPNSSPPTVKNHLQKHADIQPTISMNNKPFFNTPECKDVGLIGVEYVVKLLCEDDDLMPKYICYLCDKIRYSAQQMQDHIMDEEHRSHYCDIHFPTAMRHLSDYVESFNVNTRSVVNKYMLQKLAEAIENHHGHSQPFTYMKEEFRKNITNIRENLTLIRHASEKNGPTFTHVFDASNPDEILERAETATNFMTEVVFERKKDMHRRNYQRPGFQRQRRFMHGRRYMEQNSRMRMRPYQHKFHGKRQNYMRNNFRGRWEEKNTNFSAGNEQQPLKSILKRTTNITNVIKQESEVSEPTASVPAMPTSTITKPLKSILKNPLKKQNETSTAVQSNENLEVLPTPPAALLAKNAKARAIHESVVSINKLLQQNKNHVDTTSASENQLKLSTLGIGNLGQLNASDDVLKVLRNSLQDFYQHQNKPRPTSSLSNALQSYTVPKQETNQLVRAMPKAANVTLLAETVKKFQRSEKMVPSIKRETADIDLISVLRRLIALDNYVGSLVDKLTALFFKALNMKLLSAKEIHERLLTSDNRQFLQLISEKFKGVLISQLATDDQAKKALKTAIEQIEQLLAL